MGTQELDMAGPTETSVMDQAAMWFVKLRAEGSSKSDRAEFAKWIDTSPEHRDTYQAYADCWDEMQDYASDNAIMDMRRDALESGQQKPMFEWHRFAAMAASLLVLIVSGVLVFGSFSPPQANVDQPVIATAPQAAAPKQIASAPPAEHGQSVYQTGVGQRSTINLPDGSALELNTDSLVQVNYSAERRELVLLRGEAMFRVAKDKTRPFTVEANGKKVTALGTIFTVRRDTREVKVTLLEGVVTVDEVAVPDRPKATLATATLRPGQQLLALTGQPFAIGAVNTEIATSWRRGRLVFDNQPLSQVVAEVNRYFNQNVVIGDAELRELRVSGTYSTGSIKNFTDAMEASFPIKHRVDAKSNRVVLEIAQ